MEEIKEYRSATLDEGSIDKTNKTLEVSVCSDAPYLRSFGYETLSITSEDCDLQWLSSGFAPVLLDHDPNDSDKHIGVVQTAWIDGNKVRVKIKFSDDESKQGIINDILSGVRGNFSIGYTVVSKSPEGKIRGVDNYRCKFAIYEVSSVAIPADSEVGLGRSLENKTEQLSPSNEMKEEQPKEKRKLVMENENKQTVDETAIRTQIQKENQKRFDDIEMLCKKFKMEDQIGEYVRSSKSYDEVREDVLAKIEARSATVPAVSFPVDVVRYGAPAVHTREKDRFSISKAIRAASTNQWKGAEFESDESQRLAEINKKAFTGNNFFIDVNSPATRASNTVGTVNGGADLVGTQFAPGGRWIDLLIAKTICDRLGVDMSLTGLDQGITIPRFTTGTTAAWGAETASLGNSSAMGTDALNMTPNRLTVKAQFSRQLLIQGFPAIDARIERDILDRIALAVDTAMVHGTGSSNQPLGLLNVPGLSIVALGTNGATTVTWSQVNALMKNVDVANALMGNLKFLGNAKVTNNLKTTLKDTNTNAIYLLDDANMLAGHPYVASNIIRSDLTKGTTTTCSPLIFGNWGDAMIAQWGAIEMVTDPYTAGDTGEVIVRAYSFWDVDFRHKESFSAIVDLNAS